MSGRVERFHRMHAYERDCGGAVLASLDSVPDAGRAAPVFARALNTAAHIQAARHIWLARLAGGTGPDQIFFDHAELGQVERMTADMDEAWEHYIQDLAEEEIARVASFTSMQGTPHRSPVADILAHVFNHGTYHRGQIAMLVAQAQGKPAVTDFIFYAYREPEA